MITRVVQENMDERQHRIECLDRLQEPDGRGGVDSQGLDHPGLAGLQIDRKQPSSSKFVFGTARWLRGLVREQPGRAIAYIDWSTQEIAIAAGLSGDERMAEDYQTDPYLGFAKAARLVPADA